MLWFMKSINMLRKPCKENEYSFNENIKSH